MRIRVHASTVEKASVLNHLHELVRQTRDRPLPERLQYISDRFNGRVAWVFTLFGLWAAQAGDLRVERDEARAALREWEAMTPNRLRLKADRLEEEEREVATAEGMVVREIATTDDMPLVR